MGRTELPSGQNWPLQDCVTLEEELNVSEPCHLCLRGGVPLSSDSVSISRYSSPIS